MQDHKTHYDPNGGKVHFGDKEGHGSGDSFVPSARIAMVAEVFKKAGIPYQVEEDVLFSMWWKFMAGEPDLRIIKSAVWCIPLQ